MRTYPKVIMTDEQLREILRAVPNLERFKMPEEELFALMRKAGEFTLGGGGHSLIPPGPYKFQLSRYYMPGDVDPKRLNDLRKQCGMTRDEAAKAFGISRDYLDKILCKRAVLRPQNKRVISRIVKALNERSGQEFKPADLADDNTKKGVR